MVKKLTYFILLFFALYSPSAYALGTQCPLGDEKICPVVGNPCTDPEKVTLCVPYCPNKPNDASVCPDSEKIRTPITMFQQICAGDNTVFKPDKLTGNLIRCSQKLIFKGGDRLIISYTSMFASWIHYIVILAILFFGIKMMFGLTMEKGITLVMIAKITLVLYMTSYPGTFRLLQLKDALYQGSSNLVINILRVPDDNDSFFAKAIDVSSLFGGLSSMICSPEGRLLGGTVGDFQATNPDGSPKFRLCNKNLGSVFDDIDVLLFKLYGLDDEQANSTDPNQKKFNGLIVFAVGLFFTGSIGLSMTMIFITYFLAIAFAFGQILMLFIICMIAINFLVAIAPLALAGILFDQTKRMTKVWFNYLLTYTILPVVLAAFLWLIGIVLYGMMQQPEYIDARAKIMTSIDKMKNVDLISNDSCAIASDKPFNYDTDRIAISVQNSLTSGKANSADFAFQENNCLQVPQLDIATDNSTDEEKNKLINREDLKSLTSINLGLIIFFMIIVSMIKELPKIASSIAGNAASGAADIVAKPIHFIERKIEGTGKTLGIKPSDLFKKR
jgi:hypothetical protein